MMKKFALSLVLILLFTFSIIADEGDIHTGGKTCPQGQTCLVADPAPAPDTTDHSFYKQIFDYLKNFFG